MLFRKQISVLSYLVFISITSASCQNHEKDRLPDPIGFVNDFESIFSRAEKRYLDSIISKFEKITTIQIAVITVDTSMTDKKEFDNYILRIANKWGVGQKEKNNGIAVGFSKAYRVIRIQNGYGIERILSDAETKEIIDNAFIPDFKQGKIF
ncbi:MAG TPA: TPM domain-containing protein [Chitinophagaceae bacterium]|nr:TPM domain-containing protein [Chitinophagaceae bacterium]